MQYKPSLPIYQQVEMDIIKDMLNGKLSPGSKMPSGRELALVYKINPNTAQRVYQELEHEGLCYTKRGMGTFVTEEEERLKTERIHLAKEYSREFLQRMKDLSVSKEQLRKYLEEELDASS